MSLAIKNNQLKGFLNDGQKWEVKLSVSKSKLKGVFFINGKILINDVYQTTHVVSYKGEIKGEYKKALQTLIIDCENSLGIEILLSKLKISA